ncbi:MAG TPA: hypothetical protein VE777_12990 [Gaiellales bacterium]|jgi:hypothetical protein|nr:hypothetical protein [Gaiellales bacterium]
MRTLTRAEVEELGAVVADFERRRRAARPFPGLLEAIPGRVARLLLELGWRVDDTGAWVSPRDGRAHPWLAAVEEELARAR